MDRTAAGMAGTGEASFFESARAAGPRSAHTERTYTAMRRRLAASPAGRDHDVMSSSHLQPSDAGHPEKVPQTAGPTHSRLATLRRSVGGPTLLRSVANQGPHSFGGASRT